MSLLPAETRELHSSQQGPRRPPLKGGRRGPPDGDWRLQARCRGMGDYPWFGPSLFGHTNRTEESAIKRRERIIKAKNICAECPVRQECLNEGKREAHGIWGGLTPEERRRGETFGRPKSANGNTYKTHCPHGHELSGDNLYVPPSGSRMCRTCRRERMRERRR